MYFPVNQYTNPVCFIIAQFGAFAYTVPVKKFAVQHCDAERQNPYRKVHHPANGLTGKYDFLTAGTPEEQGVRKWLSKWIYSKQCPSMQTVYIFEICSRSMPFSGRGSSVIWSASLPKQLLCSSGMMRWRIWRAKRPADLWRSKSTVGFGAVWG